MTVALNKLAQTAKETVGQKLISGLWKIFLRKRFNGLAGKRKGC